MSSFSLYEKHVQGKLYAIRSKYFDFRMSDCSWYKHSIA